MPTFQTKPVFVRATHFTGDTSALAQAGYITHTAYRLFDGTIVDQNVARQRTYPLGQQPAQVCAIIDSDGMLRAVDIGCWIVKDDSGSVTVVQPEVFAATYVEAPSAVQTWPVPPLA